jgi:CheY-like chemotaxis protein
MLLKDYGKLPIQTMHQILVIDDDSRQRGQIGRALTGAGYGVTLACDGQQGMAAYRSMRADLVVSDLVMPEKDGVEFLFELRADFPAVPVVMMSAGGLGCAAASLEMTRELGATRTLKKPFSDRQILTAVQEVLAHRRHS